jgi:predicted RNA binding protein YcfA (HicA-like mRNA interferase family)
MKPKEVIRLIEKDGWYLKRQPGGSHRIYKTPH